MVSAGTQQAKEMVESVSMLGQFCQTKLWFLLCFEKNQMAQFEAFGVKLSRKACLEHKKSGALAWWNAEDVIYIMLIKLSVVIDYKKILTNWRRTYESSMKLDCLWWHESDAWVKRSQLATRMASFMITSGPEMPSKIVHTRERCCEPFLVGVSDRCREHKGGVNA